MQKRVETAKSRRKLGFNDTEVDADGKTIRAEEGNGVSDHIMDELAIKQKKYFTAEKEKRDRKKIPIVVPVQGISRDEY